MNNCLDIILQIVALASGNKAKLLAAEENEVKIHFTDNESAASVCHLITSVFEDSNAAGLAIDFNRKSAVPLIIFNPETFKPKVAALKTLLREIENITIIASNLSYSADEVDFNSSVISKISAGNNSGYTIDLSNPDRNRLLKDLFHSEASLFKSSLTSDNKIFIPDSIDFSPELEKEGMFHSANRLSRKLGMNGYLNIHSPSFHDDELDQLCCLVTVDPKTDSDKVIDESYEISLFVTHLIEEQNLLPQRDFRIEHDKIIIPEITIKSLRRAALNCIIVDSLLRSSPALRYLGDFTVEKGITRSDLSHPVYYIASDNPSSIIYLHKFLREDIGLEAGANYFEHDTDTRIQARYWVEISEDELGENISYLRLITLNLGEHCQVIRQLRNIPGISRVKLKNGMIRIRCDQATFETLSKLDGVEIPKISNYPPIARRAYSNRVYFQPDSLYRQMDILGALGFSESNFFYSTVDSVRKVA